MSDLQRYKEQQMQNPEFKDAYEKTRVEYELMRALGAARTDQNLTQ